MLLGWIKAPLLLSIVDDGKFCIPTWENDGCFAHGGMGWLEWKSSMLTLMPCLLSEKINHILNLRYGGWCF